jgi:hypothetical protein
MGELIVTLRQVAPIVIPIMGLLGILGIISSFQLSKTINDMTNWKVTKGNLLGCRTITIHHKMRSGFVKIETGQTHFVVIRYKYFVDGQKYVGSNFKLAQQKIPVDTRKQGERISGKFKAMPDLDVHYDPQNPSMAVLIPTAPGDQSDPSMSNLIGGIVLTILVVAMLLYFRPYGF